MEAHKKLLAYLKEMPAEKPVAVFVLNTHLRQIQDFTTDHTALLTAVGDSTRSAQTSPLLKTAKETARDMKDEDDLHGLAAAARKASMPQPMIGLYRLRKNTGPNGTMLTNHRRVPHVGPSGPIHGSKIIDFRCFYATCPGAC